MRGLAGRRCVVTAGLGGIGLRITKRLLEDGAEVYPTTRERDHGDEFLARLGDEDRARCHPLELSFDTDSSIDVFLDELAHETPSIFGLVNTASNREFLGDAMEVRREYWVRHFGVDVFGTAYLTTRLASDFIEDGGAIVNLSSMYGARVPDKRIYDAGTVPATMMYGTAKAALDYLTKYLAVEYAPRGIRVNAVLAGGVANPERQSERFVRELSKRTPMARLASAGEFDGAVEFFLSEGSSYCTGQLLEMDGGGSLW